MRFKMINSRDFRNMIMECQLMDKCGKIEDLDFDVEYVNSKDKAIKMINSLEWENLCLDERNDFTGFLYDNYKDLYNKNWNVEVQKIKGEYMNEIQKKIETNWNDKDSEQYVIDDVEFNIISIFMLNVYSEYYKSDFYEKMFKIYLAGHLPCGWSGDYPNGKFIVY